MPTTVNVFPARAVCKFEHMKKMLGDKMDIYYAMKCNPDPEILKRLSDSGCYFDIASVGEMKQLRQLNISSKMLYTNPYTKTCDLQELWELGVRRVVIDNELELDKLKGFSFEVIIRMKVYNKQCDINLSDKYGTEEVESLLEKSAENKINVIGFSFHVGSRNHDLNVHLKMAQTCMEYVKTMHKYGMDLKVIDIGGGFVDEIETDELFWNIRDFINRDECEGIEWICEPGRYISESAVEVETEIVGKRRVTMGNDTRIDYIVDDSVYMNFNNVVYDHKTINPNDIELYAKISMDKERMKWINSRIYGQTCDSCDIVRDNIEMPSLSIGDKLTFRKMGAYTLSSAGVGFNGFSQKAIKYVDE